MADYSKLTDEKFDSILENMVREMPAGEILSYSGVYEILREELNNAVLDQWVEDNPETQVFKYYINLDERGEFYADVRDPDEKTVFEIKGFQIFEDGFMDNKDDIEGLEAYMVELGIMDEDNTLEKGN